MLVKSKNRGVRVIKKRRLPKYVAFALPAVAVVGLVAGLELTNTTHLFHSSQKSGSSQTDSTSTTPAKQDTSSSSSQPAAQKPGSPGSTTTPEPSQPTSAKKHVTPIITSPSPGQQTTGDITVKAYVAGIIEDGGTCTATFTRNGVSVSGTSDSVANATDTVCSIKIDRSKFKTSGNWLLVLHYSSAKAVGDSDPQTVEVQ